MYIEKILISINMRRKVYEVVVRRPSFFSTTFGGKIELV
ncbi:hypothetical protein BURMUCF2_0209 [Burkholderia multivorans CF2]|nr:hypothetical protein BURMUCF2_0209 [Burkholderia multivorans CF2]